MKQRYSTEELTLINNIIQYLQDTKEEDWCIDVVRKDNKNCFFGHIFNYGLNGIDIPNYGSFDGEKGANALWDWFENAVASTDRIYPVNDGEDLDYQQATPRERCIAFIQDILTGKKPNTFEAMESCANN